MENGNYKLKSQLSLADRLNGEIRECLAEACQQMPNAEFVLKEVAADLDLAPGDMDRLLDRPVEVPLNWLVAVAHRLGVAVRVASILCRNQ